MKKDLVYYANFIDKVLEREFGKFKQSFEDLEIELEPVNVVYKDKVIEGSLFCMKFKFDSDHSLSSNLLCAYGSLMSFSLVKLKMMKDKDVVILVKDELNKKLNNLLEKTGYTIEKK